MGSTSNRSPSRIPATPSAIAAMLVAAVLLLDSVCPDTSAAVEVKRLEFKGNRSLGDRMLKSLCDSAPALFDRPAFTEHDLDADIEAILSAYRDEGYLGARLTDRVVRFVDGGRSVEILLRVDEGPRTRISQLSIEGASGLTEKELMRQIRSRPGDPYRRRQLLADQRALRAAYGQRGRLETITSYRAVEDTAGGGVHLMIHIEESPVLRLGAVRVEGLEKTHAPVVRKQVRLKRGSPLKYGLLRQTQTALYGTGLFTNVIVEPVQADSGTADLRDLLIRVRERPSGTLDFGGGYGTSERFRVRFSVSQDNVGGWARQLGFSGRLSRFTRHAQIAYSDPTAWSRQLSINGRAFYDRNRNESAEFTARRVGAETGLTYFFKPGWIGETRYLFERVTLVEGERSEARGQRNTSSVSWAARHDSRNDLLAASQGRFLELRLEYAGGLLGGQNHFLRTSIVSMSYLRIFKNLVLAMKTEARQIRSLRKDEDIPLYERLYLGGDGSVRGYERGQIGAPNGGGLAYSALMDLRYSRTRWGAVIFLDNGQVWKNLEALDWRDQRVGYGGGVRYVSPIGLLRLDAAYRGGAESLLRRMELYFGVGQAF